MMTSNDEIELRQTARMVESRQIFIGTPKTVGRLAARVLSTHAVAAEQATSNLLEAWIKVAGAEYQNSTFVGSVKRHRLEITCSNSLINQQLTFQKQQLVEGMNREVPSLKIKDISFRIGPVQSTRSS
jgi:hypothetical protein